jgi:hypothetical protein
MSLQDTFKLGQALEEVDNLKITLAGYRAALERITELNPSEDSEEGYNEWGEADCFRQARRIAGQALKD